MRIATLSEVRASNCLTRCKSRAREPTLCVAGSKMRFMTPPTGSDAKPILIGAPGLRKIGGSRPRSPNNQAIKEDVSQNAAPTAGATTNGMISGAGNQNAATPPVDAPITMAIGNLNTRRTMVRSVCTSVMQITYARRSRV